MTHTGGHGALKGADTLRSETRPGDEMNSAALNPPSQEGCVYGPGRQWEDELGTQTLLYHSYMPCFISCHLMMDIELLSPLVFVTICCLIVMSTDGQSELSVRTKQAERS